MRVSLANDRDCLVTVRQSGGAWLWEARWDGQDHSGFVWEESQIPDDVRRAFTGDLRAPILAYTSSPSLTSPHVPTGAGATLATPVEPAVEVDTMSFVHEPEAANREYWASIVATVEPEVDENPPSEYEKFVNQTLRNSQGHYWTPVAQELSVLILKGKSIPQEATSPLYCEHANAGPTDGGECRCKRWCYCRVVGNCGTKPRTHTV